MPQDREREAGRAGRPRSKEFLRLNLDNPYSQLKISPFATTEEIADRISQRRAMAMKRSRAKASRSINDQDEQEILLLDKIHEEIGDPKRRKKYDEEYPQNILLTVQASPAEQAWLRYREAGLITEWLHDSLGDEVFLPTPRCLRLWAPAGIDPLILKLLDDFVAEQPKASAPGADNADVPASTPSIVDLERLTKE